MLVTLEIVLTAIAWVQGWGAKALAPSIGTSALGIVATVATAFGGPHLAYVRPLAFLFDLAILGVLLYMVEHPRKQADPVRVKSEVSLPSERESQPSSKVARIG
jgi:hypothetical protein